MVGEIKGLKACYACEFYSAKAKALVKVPHLITLKTRLACSIVVLVFVEEMLNFNLLYIFSAY